MLIGAWVRAFFDMLRNMVIASSLELLGPNTDLRCKISPDARKKTQNPHSEKLAIYRDLGAKQPPTLPRRAIDIGGNLATQTESLRPPRFSHTRSCPPGPCSSIMDDEMFWNRCDRPAKLLEDVGSKGLTESPIAVPGPRYVLDRTCVLMNTCRMSITPKAIQVLLDDLEASKQSRLRAWNPCSERCDSGTGSEDL
jgi:hypothetical protein